MIKKTCPKCRIDFEVKQLNDKYCPFCIEFERTGKQDRRVFNLTIVGLTLIAFVYWLVLP